MPRLAPTAPRTPRRRPTYLCKTLLHGATHVRGNGLEMGAD